MLDRSTGAGHTRLRWIAFVRPSNNPCRCLRPPEGWPDSRRLRRKPRMSTVSLTVNGQSVTADVDPRTLLVHFLRDNLRLTGTHVGCDTSQCGACVVHVNGQAVKSCTTLAVQADGAQVTTIEGIAANGQYSPMQ